MKNEIHLIKSADLQDLSVSENTHLAILDGKTVQTESDILEWLGIAYQLPNWSNWDSVQDWLEDLTWLDASDFVLVITEVKSLLMEDPAARSVFLRLLVERILPHWERKVLYTVLCGLPKSFQLYLIMD